MILDRKPILIDEMLNPDFTFYAHTKKEENLNYECDETLAEHTNRSIAHFKGIIEAKKLEDVFLRFEQVWLRELKDDGINLFRDMLLNTITFHDIGKINPLFQKDKMKNPQFAKERGSVLFSSNHAPISAMLYLEYFLPKTAQFSKEVKKKLMLLVYVNAYVISKHHSTLKDIKEMKDGIRRDGIRQDYDNKWQVLNTEYKKYFRDSVTILDTKCNKYENIILDNAFPTTRKEGMFLYTYAKLMYSLLVASDYYATTQYSNEYMVKTYGTIHNINEMIQMYEKSDVMNKIRNNKPEKEIDVLRSELFLEAEKILMENKEENLFYLEAPTGSGKSNTAFNLSFKLIEHCPKLQKIWYIYPFNTLVEQNISTIEKLFKNSKILEQISIVNSITQIGNHAGKRYDESKDDIPLAEYNKQLLDRQFFHYPIVLSTHITLFDILFGSEKESGFAFYQLANSVIVLDEIQSYRNELWTEIITFLKEFADLLNLKIIIMSATLPDLDYLSKEQTKAVKLIKNRDKYFLHSCFKDRVQICYDLLEQDNVIDRIVSCMKYYLLEGKKVLIEFLSKTAAEEFFSLMHEKELTCDVRLMTGDDNSAERKMILEEINNTPEGVAFLLIATQVVEAGVDLQGIDIGFKDISMLDAEEQFMGRVNRSCTKNGKVYFFNLNQATTIYGGDIRLDKGLTLEALPMRAILEEKNFTSYYQKVLEGIIAFNKSMNIEMNLDAFLRKAFELNFTEVSKRMKLIKESNQTISVFFARNITVDGVVISGVRVWEDYKGLLLNSTMDYAEKRVKLSGVKSKMNYFMYQVRQKELSSWNEQIGEIYYIKDGEKYFDHGKLDKRMLREGYCDFI